MKARKHEPTIIASPTNVTDHCIGTGHNFSRHPTNLRVGLIFFEPKTSMALSLQIAKATTKILPRALVGRGPIAASAASTTPRQRFLATATHDWPHFGEANNSSRTFAGRSKNYGKYAALAFGAAAAAQYYFGEAEEFFDHRLITTKNPEDLADFYGTEAFMDIFCVLPFMASFMMRGGDFDDEGHIHTYGLAGPGNLEVSIDFAEAEEDTTGDGEPDTIAWFNKREQFHDTSPIGNLTLWRMTQNFGYHRLHDGTCEVYHNGEYFKGLFPIRILFQAHAAYVFWATKRFINSAEFGSEELEDEAEVYRQNIPKQIFKEFIIGLTKEVEAVQQTKSSEESKQEYDKTIEKLKDIADDEQKVTVAHFRTLRRRDSSLTKLKLVVDDADTQETITNALKQVGEAKGMRNAPVSSVSNLQRHVTKAQALEEE